MQITRIIDPSLPLPIPATPEEAQLLIKSKLTRQPDFFEGYNFEGWPLERVIFPAGTRLLGAQFSQNNATHAVFSHCDLRKTKWKSVSGQSINLFGADLSLAIIEDTNFTSAEFSEAKIRDCKISGSTFNHASAKNTVFEGTEAVGNQMRFMDLSSSFLCDVTFVDNDLRGAKLEPSGPGPHDLIKENARTSGAIFSANWYDAHGPIPTVREIHQDAFRHRLTSRLLGTSVQTGIGYLLDRGYEVVQEGFRDLASHSAIPGSQVVLGTVILFGIVGLIDERVRYAALRTVMRGAGSSRVAMAAAGDYCRQRGDLVAFAGTKEATKRYRLALMAVRRSWAPDPLHADKATEFKPSYRVFGSPSLSIVVCNRQHLDHAIQTMTHSGAPTVKESLILARDVERVPLGVPAAIGIDPSHHMIAAYNIPSGSKKGLSAVAVFYEPSGTVLRIERIPPGAWEIPEPIQLSIKAGGEHAVSSFITMASEQIGTTKTPAPPKRRCQPVVAPDRGLLIEDDNVMGIA